MTSVGLKARWSRATEVGLVRLGGGGESSGRKSGVCLVCRGGNSEG